MAPILSFTAEELWQHFTGQTGRQRLLPHLAPAAGSARTQTRLLAKWTTPAASCATPVRKQIEDLRAAGKVGSSLQAEVDLSAPPAGLRRCSQASEDELKFLMITSSARVSRASEARAAVRASEHQKCERCWHYRPDVNGEGLVRPLPDAIFSGPGETRKYV